MVSLFLWGIMKTENGKKLEVTWEQCQPTCHGWLHMSSPFEIQACDACNRFKENSELKAIEAHAEECGCGWPERDLQDAAMSWLKNVEPCANGRPTDSQISDLELLLDVRGEGFLNNINPATFLCNQLIDVSEGSTKENLKGLMAVLRQVREGFGCGKLTVKDFGSPDSFQNEPRSIRPDMTQREIIKALRDRGGELYVDDCVFEAAEDLASRVNNEGLESQIDFLVDEWGLEVVQNALIDDYQCDDPDCPDGEKMPYHDHPKVD